MENDRFCNYYFTRKRTKRFALAYLVLWTIGTAAGIVLGLGLLHF